MSAAQEFMNECTALEIEIIKLKSEKRELLEACKLFIKYDATDEDSSIQMMLNYAAALEASKSAIAKAEGSPS